MNITIVIPNKNGEKLLESHLPKVLDGTLGCEVIVVDDRSTDGSKAVIKKYKRVQVIDGPGKGFASSVNEGVRHAKGDIVVLLNTDVQPHKDFLKALVRHFNDPDVFAVGCMDRSHEADGSIILRGRGIAKWDNGFFVHQKGEVTNFHDTAWVSGGSAAFRKRIWDELGGMDTMYNPFYWEDIDISYRAVKAGYRIVFEPESIVEHYHESGSIRTDYSESKIQKIAFRNQLLFIWKNASDMDIIIKHCIYLPIYIIRSLKRNCTGMFGFIQALIRIPYILSSRNRASKFWKMRDRDMTYPTF